MRKTKRRQTAKAKRYSLARLTNRDLPADLRATLRRAGVKTVEYATKSLSVGKKGARAEEPKDSADLLTRGLVRKYPGYGIVMHFPLDLTGHGKQQSQAFLIKGTHATRYMLDEPKEG